MDNFFYNMNQKLKEVLDTPKSEHQQLNEGAVAEASTGDYSAKKARAGKDIGKPGKAFAQIAKSAGEKYGSKERGEKVAGAVLAKLRGKNESAGDMEESAFQAAIGKKKYGADGMKALQKAGREHASAKTMSNIRNKYDKYDESMEEGMFDSLKAGMSKVGKVAKKGLETLGHGSDDAMRKDLQKKMGLPQTGKKPTTEGDFGPMEGEGGTPMTPKQKKFAKLAPPADKITFADKIAGAKKEVDEMLGDVAAEAIKGALTGGQKKLDKNHNGKLDAQDFAMLRAGKGRKETDEGSDWSQLGKEYSKPKVGSIERGHKHDIEHTATGRRVTRRTDDQGISVGADDDAPAAGEKRRGRPKGTGKAMGAKGPSGKSKLMTRESDQELDEAIAKLEAAGYTVEKAPPGAKAERMVKHIKKSLSKDGKLSDKDKAIAYATTWKAHKQGKVEEESDEKRDEKAEKAGKKVAKDIEYDEKKKDHIHGKKRGSEDDKAEKAGKKVTKDIEYDEKKDKKEDKPKKVKEEGGTGTPTASSGFGYGKGIYDSINRELEQMIAESMSINASDSTEGGKSLTITATDEDALKLGALLKSAGLGGSEHAEPHGEVEVVGVESPISGDEGACETCGSHDCGCGDVEEALEENEPNWPTDEVESDDPFQYSGGLNKPKSTGQTTVPVIAHQDSRMGVDGDEELRRMMEMAGIESDLKPWERTMKEETEEDLEEAKEEELDEAAKQELDESKCNECGMYESKCKCDESVEESLARFRSLAGLKEAAKPDYIDLDKDGDREESMKKAADDKEDKKVEESIFAMTNLWKAYKG